MKFFVLQKFFDIDINETVLEVVSGALLITDTEKYNHIFDLLEKESGGGIFGT